MEFSTNEVTAILISHRHKFIYTKTAKTGGTSVESYFERFCMPSNEWTLSHGRDEYISEQGIIGFRGSNPPEDCMWQSHMSAARIREKVGEEVWATYFKFCVIRNPYEKAISSFYFFRQLDNGSVEFKDLEHARVTFENWLLDGSQLQIDRNKYIIGGDFCLDTVVRYENLAADLERVCARVSVPWNPSSLPDFKAGIRPSGARAEALYTKKSREIVEAAYSFELDYFKYSFPSGDLPAPHNSL